MPICTIFMQMFAPHLTKDLIDAAAATADNRELETLFEKMRVPNC